MRSRSICRLSALFALIVYFAFSSCGTSKGAGALPGNPGNTAETQISPDSTQNIQLRDISGLFPPESRENEYYKIQILAVTDYQSAEREKKRLRDYTDKTIYLIKEQKLWKVQIGDYNSRNSAESDSDYLKKLGWNDAWIVQFRENNPVKTTKTAEEVKSAEINTKTIYTVQVIATTNKNEAEKLQNNLKLLNIQNSSLSKTGEFWRIQVGEYEKYEDAGIMLKKIKEMGFNDSWITKKSSPVNEPVSSNIKKPFESFYYIDIFSSESKESAQKEAGRIYLLTENRPEVSMKDSMWSVRLGPYSDVYKAESLAKLLIGFGFKESKVVK